MNEESHPELVEYHLPECDTIGFEIDHFPAPLEWDGGSFRLSWKNAPDLPADQKAKWDAVLAEIQQIISTASAAHFPAEDAVIKAFKTGLGEPVSDLRFYDVEALMTTLPLEYAGELLTPRNLRVLKEHKQMMRRNAVW